MSLDIVVCLKVVPKPEDVTIDPVTKVLDRTKAENILNPPDKNTLELALKLKDTYGGTVAVVSMGPPQTKECLEFCLGMGADQAILLSDRFFAGADTYPTSLVLARAADKVGHFDLVLCGEESADAATGQVPPGVAEWLDVPQITYVNAVKIEGNQVIAKRALGSSYEVVSAPMPALLSVVIGVNTPRFPDFGLVDSAAREGKIEVWTAADLGLTEEEVGLKGSYTTVHELVEGEPVERKRNYLEGDTRQQARALVQILEPFLKGG